MLLSSSYCCCRGYFCAPRSSSFSATAAASAKVLLLEVIPCANSEASRLVLLLQQQTDGGRDQDPSLAPSRLCIRCPPDALKTHGSFPDNNTVWSRFQRVKTITFSSFHRIFLEKIIALFRSGNFEAVRPACPEAIWKLLRSRTKLIADTEHGIGTGPAPYCIDSVSRRAGLYLET